MRRRMLARCPLSEGGLTTCHASNARVAVLMIRPAAFDYNPETAPTNSMQQRPGEHGAGSHNERARAEFQRPGARARERRRFGVRSGRHARAAEARRDLSEQLGQLPRRRHRRAVSDARGKPAPRAAAGSHRCSGRAARASRCRALLDLTHHELQGRCLEGTGSLVLDHANRVAYASVSPRTHPAVVEEWCRELGYEPVHVRVRMDRAGAPIYHTNVLMCIGERVVVVGTDAIAPADRERVLERLRGERARDHRDRPSTKSSASPATCWSSRAGTKRSATAACS